MALKPERFPLFLYKSILRLHYGLPPPARLMGDTYVKDEFRRHKDAGPEFVKQFISEWTVSFYYFRIIFALFRFSDYCVTLSKQLSTSGIRKGVIGQDLTPDRIQSLSDEHVQQLVELRVEADKHMGREDFIETLNKFSENKSDKS